MWRCDVRVKDKILYRHNVHKIDSIEEFYNKDAEVKSGYKDVYFVRLLGVDQGYTEKIKTMDEKVSSREIYIRVDKLIPSFDLDIINLYEEYYNMMTLSGIDVLLLQCEKDIQLNKELAQLSTTCVIGEFKTIDIPQYTRSNSTDRIRVVIPSRPPRRSSTQKKVKDQIYSSNISRKFGRSGT